VLTGPAKDPLKTYGVVVEDEIGRVEAAEVQRSKSATSEA
jgi:hypothetical protein